jgi:hypothetical protein
MQPSRGLLCRHVVRVNVEAISWSESWAARTGFDLTSGGREGGFITSKLPSRDGLISFVFNCGDGGLKGSSLHKHGGRVLPNLVRRRKVEADIFMGGVALQRQAVAENDNDWAATVLRAA